MIPYCSRERLNLWEPDVEMERIAARFGCSSFMASLLWMRGILSSANDCDRKKWIQPNLSEWLGYVDLGAGSARARELWGGVGEGSRVIVYGDYDVDGIASTTLITELARRKGASVRYYIPDRHAQGYGFHHKVARKITSCAAKCDLLIVVDCGTQDTKAVDEMRGCGVPVVVFDHHLSRGTPADANALINPHIDGNDLGRDLCATGVVWCWAWKNELAPKEWLAKRLDLAALATVADCVSMSSPVNRSIVREGTKVLRVTERDGLRKLMQKLEIDPFTVDCTSLSMKIIPCLNAAGRLEHADTAMEIFFPKEDVDVSVQKLIFLNKKRRDFSAKIISDVESGACDNPRYRHVLFGDDWPAGVLSSVASHVCADRDTPVVLAANAQEPFIRGTLRVPLGVDAEAILSAISDDLDSWGGHRMAAGFSVERGKWAEVRDKLEEILSGIEICGEKEDILCWRPAELALDEWKDAERLGPFGVGNPYPKLFCEHSGPVCAEPLGRNGSHVKILLDGRELLGFSGANLLDAGCSPSGWVYKPRVNFWRSSENLQLILERIVTSAA